MCVATNVVSQWCYNKEFPFVDQQSSFSYLAMYLNSIRRRGHKQTQENILIIQSGQHDGDGQTGLHLSGLW